MLICDIILMTKPEGMVVMVGNGSNDRECPM